MLLLLYRKMLAQPSFILIGEVDCICALWFETVVHSFHVSKKYLYFVKDAFNAFWGYFVTL